MHGKNNLVITYGVERKMQQWYMISRVTMKKSLKIGPEYFWKWDFDQDCYGSVNGMIEMQYTDGWRHQTRLNIGPQFQNKKSLLNALSAEAATYGDIGNVYTYTYSLKPHHFASFTENQFSN